ncbi:MAG: hypothetical protein IJ366_08425 [Clostridia bacterium]|nr:hypothetical protein [Clostridia bacterium]
MGKFSPDSEDVILLKLEYLGLLDRGNEIKMLLDKIENEHIYLSAKAKEAIAFWRD